MILIQDFKTVRVCKEPGRRMGMSVPRASLDGLEPPSTGVEGMERIGLGVVDFILRSDRTLNVDE